MLNAKHRCLMTGVGVVLPLIGMSVVTQVLGKKLGYQSRLGPIVGHVGTTRIYLPWDALIWWLRYRSYAPGLFHAVRWAVPAACAPLLILIPAWSRRDGEDTPATTYGSSRWAGRRDIRSAGLFARSGVMLGRWRGRYLRHAGPDHVLVFAPTRSGKGVGLVVPTLLSWTGSAVIHDIKGENWTLTAGWRSHFSHCLRFDPTDGRSSHYNPLLEVRRGPREVADAQNIADILVDPEGVLERRNHWEQASHALLVGAILHVLYRVEDKTLASVARLLSDPDQPIVATLQTMLTANHLGTAQAAQTHPVVAAAARDLLNKSEAERSGVVSTAIGFLSLYRDPVIAAVTADSDWRITDLLDAAAPVSLYLVVPPSDLSRTRPLARLILNQIGRRLTEQLPAQPVRRRQLLLMLDEFPALGRLDFFESTLAFLAGYGVRAFLVAQSLHQLAKAYGENSSIADNCRIRITFSTNDERTAKRVSDALGTSTERRRMRSYGGSRLAAWLPHVTEARQEMGRALLTPGEIMQLPGDEALLIVSGCPPIRGRKLRYHEDRHLAARVLAPPPTATGPVWRDRPARCVDDWSNARPASTNLTDETPDAAGSPHGLGLEEVDIATLPGAGFNNASSGMPAVMNHRFGAHDDAR